MNHIITNHEAMDLIEHVDLYFSPLNYLQDGKHKTEHVIDSMMKEGLFEQAEVLHEIHNAAKNFQKGEFSSFQYIFNSNPPIIGDFILSLKNSKYATLENSDFFREIVEIDNSGVLNKDIEWDRTNAVLRQVKERSFPSSLSFTEKLNSWVRNRGDESHNLG